MVFKSLTWLVDVLIPVSADFINAYAGLDLIVQANLDSGLEGESQTGLEKETIGTRTRAIEGGGEGVDLTAGSSEKCLQADQSEHPKIADQDFCLCNHGQLGSHPEVLEKMLKHIIPGARYNSAARDPPPRCHPGTRTHILQDMNDRVLDEDTRVVWLYGPAGSGKSAVMQSLAESLSSSPQVNLATTFLSRDAKRNDPDRIFASLAYEFAITDSTYRHSIEREMASDPDFLSLSMNEQLERLFVRPLINSSVNSSQRWVILLDGLDECGSKATQKRIIEIICGFMRSHPRFTSLVWVISTREEGYLKTIFETVEETVPGFWKQEVPIGTPDTSRDVEVYLRAELGKVSNAECPSVPSWPADEDLVKLVDLCSGFFYLASSLAAHITEANPVARLAGCLSEPRKAGASGLQMLYTQIMSTIPDDVIPATKSILSFYLFQDQLTGGIAPTSNVCLSVICNILQLKQHEAYAALYHLSSVLSYPSPDRAGNAAIKIFHPSFLETLLSSPQLLGTSKSSPYEAPKIWFCYQRILQQFNKTRPPEEKNITISWALSQDSAPSLDEWPQRTMLEIARHGWMSIIINCYHPKCTRSYQPPDCLKASNRLRIRLAEMNMSEVFKRIGIDLDQIVNYIPHQIASFLDWVTDHAHSSFMNHLGRLDKTTLGGLNEARFLRALCSTRFCRRVVSESVTGRASEVTDPDLSLLNGMTPRTWEQAKERIWNDLSSLGELFKAMQHSPGTPMVILESNGPTAHAMGAARAIIGPITDSDLGGDVYYIVSY